MLTPEEIKQMSIEMGKFIEGSITPQFDSMNKRFDGIDKRLDGIDKRLDGIDTRLDGLDAQVKDIRNTMVTKDYLDKWLAQQPQLHSLVDLLEAKQMITPNEAKRLFIVNPFPQSA